MKKDIYQDFRRYSKRNPNLLNVVKLSIAKPGFRAVLLYRLGRYFKLRGLNRLASLCQRVMHHATHCYISVSADIGSGFLISHVGGIVIGGKSKIGKNCDIRQNITLGGNFSKKDESGNTQPILSDNVSLGAGACVLGPVKVGQNVVIGANSVLTKDVPDNTIVAGIPAKVIKERWNNGARKL